MQRGHNREPCFFGEEDDYTYLHWFGEALKAASCSLHAYALMTNHVHLLLTPTKTATVPKLVISLGRRYVQYIDRQYRRTGTWWDSRYKSSPIRAATYLLTCMRYLEMNPVRAAMVGPSGALALDQLASQPPRAVLIAAQLSSGLPGLWGQPTTRDA